MSSDKRKKILAGTAFGGHICVIILLWFVLKEDNIEEPVFQKVISTTFINQPPNNLPLLSKAERVQAEKERRQNEESAWNKQQQTLKKKYEAEARKKKEAELKKAAEAKKKKESKKKPPVEKKDDSQKKLLDKKKKDEIKKQKDLAAKKAADAKRKRDQEKAERIRKANEAAAQKAAADAKRREDARRQVVLGKHVTADIENRLRQEWRKGIISAIQFNDPNDSVSIEFAIARDGRVLSARITRRAKSANLNAKAATLIKTLSSSHYRFPKFPAQYTKSSMRITKSFRTVSN